MLIVSILKRTVKEVSVQDERLPVAAQEKLTRRLWLRAGPVLSIGSMHQREAEVKGEVFEFRFGAAAGSLHTCRSEKMRRLSLLIDEDGGPFNPVEFG